MAPFFSETKNFADENLPEFMHRIEILSRCKLLPKSVEKIVNYFASLILTSDGKLRLEMQFACTLRLSHSSSHSSLL